MHRTLNALHDVFHNRRAELFVRLMQPRPGERLLDLGGGDGSFAARICHRIPLDVTVADVDVQHRATVQRRGFRHVTLNSSGRLPFEREQFDMVLSNSVIEHVTLPKDRCRTDVFVPSHEWQRLAQANQQQFAREIERVGCRYFVQTPHKHFPIDPHVYLPFVQYLPRSTVCRLVLLTDRAWVNDCHGVVDWHLLDAEQMRQLFPGAEIVIERVLGLPKSIVAYGGTCVRHRPLVTDEPGVSVSASEPITGRFAKLAVATGGSLPATRGEAAGTQVIDPYVLKDGAVQISHFSGQLTTNKAGSNGAADSRARERERAQSGAAELPLVTVVVPTFARPQLLRSAIASVIAQDSGGTFRHEVVVVDNASPGGETLHVVEEMARSATVPIRYVREERGVVSYARNRGVHEASGEWIAFCDDDQIAEPDWLFELVSAARAHRAACVGGTIRLKLPTPAPALSRYCRVLLGEHLFAGAPFVCTGRDIPSGGNLLMARWVFDELGMFDTQLTPGCEDSDYVLRVRNAGYSVLVAPAAVVHHVIPPYRTKSPYLYWVSQRMGAGYAYTEVKKHGPLGVTLLCVARIGLAALITAPKLGVALLLRDRVADQECRARLWRLVGYAQQTAGLLRPKRAGDSAFSRALEFRRERVLFGTVTASTPDSKPSEVV